MNINIPKNVKFIIDTYYNNNYEAFMVGGCVRDSLLGLKPKDFDITTSALPEITENLFTKTIPTGIKHGTVTVVIDKENFEVTTYRTEENYIDRKKGAILKQHSYLVKDNFTPYLYPQECGNRTECRFCTVSSTHHEITFTADAFECSVLPYTPFVLENAKHRWELPEPYETVIMLNAKQMGIAGDNTWGAKTHPEFLLNDLHQKFHISMKAK